MIREEACAASAGWSRTGTLGVRLGAVLIAALICLGAGAGAAIAATVTFAPSFSNNGLGEGATFDAALTIAGTEYHGSPDPLTKVMIHLPAGVGGSSAGFATCEQVTLRTYGPAGCPAGSIAGPVGSVSFEFKLASETLTETGTVQAVFTQPEGQLLFFIQGVTPVAVEIIAEATYANDVSPYGRVLSLELPLIETVPGAPYASITALSIELGASRQEGVATVSSVVIPQQCPASGMFGWASDTTLYEQSAQRTTAETVCPGASGKTSTTTSLQASSTTPVVGEAVAYTATVTPALAGPTEPSGSVEFLDAGLPINGCSEVALAAGLSGSTAVCRLSYATPGSHSITAAYAGDTGFFGSVSTPQTVTVQASGNSAPTGGGDNGGGSQSPGGTQPPGGGGTQGGAPGHVNGPKPPLTRKQKLAAALRECGRLKPKAKRKRCEAGAHRRYGAKVRKRARGGRRG